MRMIPYLLLALSGVASLVRVRMSLRKGRPVDAAAEGDPPVVSADAPPIEPSEREDVRPVGVSLRR